MVEILKYTFKDHLVKTPVSTSAVLPSPSDLRNKILIKVKYVDPKKAAAKVQAAKSRPTETLQQKPSSASHSSSASEDQDTPGPSSTDPKKKKKKSAITPALSDMGVYTRSYHFSTLTSSDATIPAHVFSLSEKKLMEVHQSSGPTLFSHNRNFLMRAFPSGLRVRSDNLDPSVFWRKGVQIVALNWQRWDEGMMLNEGMFTGSKGWVLKPNGYLGNRDPASTKPVGEESQADAIAHKTLTLDISIFAGQDIPLPLGDTRPEGFHPYVKVELHVEKPAERTGAPIEGSGKSKEGEYKQRTRTGKGTEVDFGGEKMHFRDIPGVVEELSFIRYVSCITNSLSKFSLHCYLLRLLACVPASHRQVQKVLVGILSGEGDRRWSLAPGNLFFFHRTSLRKSGVVGKTSHHKAVKLQVRVMQLGPFGCGSQIACIRTIHPTTHSIKRD